MSHELLSSVTVSTGSFLSYEVTDLSLTGPGTIKLCECSEGAPLAARQCGDGGKHCFSMLSPGGMFGGKLSQAYKGKHQC